MEGVEDVEGVWGGSFCMDGRNVVSLKMTSEFLSFKCTLYCFHVRRIIVEICILNNLLKFFSKSY